MVFNDRRCGVPGISLTNWPDTYIHSTDDDLLAVDAATQPQRLHRGDDLLHSPSAESTLQLTALVLGGAQRRMGVTARP
jgi:hypothetical protein